MSFKREAFLYNLFHCDKNYSLEADRLLKSFPETKTILEIGAGTGLMTKELQARGCEVVGIEPSPQMLRYWVADKNTRVYLTAVEKIDRDFFESGQFDLVIAAYDILNYVKPKDYLSARAKLGYWGKNVYTEEWDNGPVPLIRTKMVNGIKRIRFGLKLGKTVHLWYIYPSIACVEKHTLFIHGKG